MNLIMGANNFEAVIAILLNIAKALDSLSYSGLSSKVKSYGMDPWRSIIASQLTLHRRAAIVN